MKQIEIENVKKFTSALFASNTFDTFCVTEASFSTLVNITIDGHINQEFLKPSGSEGNAGIQVSAAGAGGGAAADAPASSGHMESQASSQATQQIAIWQQLRPLCYEAIKGSKAPLKFKIIFMTPPEKVAGFISKQGLNLRPSDVTGLFMNIRFEGGKLSCISGSSTKSFSLDKSLENAWDASVEGFIRKFSVKKTISI